MDRLTYCHCCGALRGRSTPRAAITMSSLLEIADHRPMQRSAGQLFERSPQLRVAVQVYRNGGGLSEREHVCDECLDVGIRHAIEALQELLPRGIPHA